MHAIRVVVALAWLVAGSCYATLIPIDLSPTPGLALNSANYALGDHTLGLSAPNAVAQPASPATGDEIGAGIIYDDVSMRLSYEFAYGSDFGFVDMVGAFTVAHIHGPVAVQFPAVNTGAGVVVGLTHTPGTTANTGSFVGSVVLTPTQEADLLNNLLYINVHSSFATGGEIRGQLVPVVPEPGTLGLLAIGILTLARRRTR